MSRLQIKNLQARVDGQHILRGVDLNVESGQIHALMGPNGAGKSTLAYVLAGHPNYEVIADGDDQPKSHILLDDHDLLEMSPDERSRAGLFLAFQYPVEVPGVKVRQFLWEAFRVRFADRKNKLTSILEFRKHLEKLAEELQVNPQLLTRGLNEGFSGGEKKRLEVLQMAVLEPKFAILDETDSGLDIDAIKIVAKGVKQIVDKFGTGILVITHYQRILKYLEPEFVHVMQKGQISQSGGPELAEKLEEAGYEVAS